jgi:acyl-CoA thioester hydrolase
MSRQLSSIHLADLPETARQTIPAEYLDLMGHMNVMWYTHLFSNATIRFFEMIGLTREYMQANRSGSFALEVHVRYYAEVHVGQEVVLYTRALGRSAKRFHMMHFLSIGEETLSATSEFVSAHIDLTTRRMAPLPEPIAAALDRLIDQHRRLSWQPPVCGVMAP